MPKPESNFVVLQFSDEITELSRRHIENIVSCLTEANDVPELLSTRVAAIDHMGNLQPRDPVV